MPRTRRTLLVAALLAGACRTPPPPAAPPAEAGEVRDAALEARLAALAREVDGDVGIYVRHLRTGRTAALRADETFPTASLIKVPILVGVFDAFRTGRLDPHATLVYRDSLAYPGADLVAKLRDSARVPLQKVALHMITTSDNTASLWLQGLVGGAAVNAWLAAHGFDSTRVNSRVPGREADRTRMGWGQTTPREMARLLTAIRDGRAVSRAASEEMYRYLTRIYWNGEALSQLPPWVQAASKQGAVDRSRSEVVLVNAPSGDYVFAVITRNQRDTTYAPGNQGYVLLRRVSALLWREFEPGRPWAPDPAAAALKPADEGP
ncbi:serine hydrolase [Roseisolibacter sp. H3M3-2]|uniref:serine hydrolase n=1 Tax=Roseisolibacter sp. H3M3-2 TaxID=3031323 RepID=UPI0023DA397F|nr:serine hydrolase [Roseisolibacter sp. H3M3-2]MDF1505746.1 class A beta-lactamase-related serine hydrolase [Roseisolibacter sp. H3M3-2]